jgi:hypothetical protein
LVLIYLILDPIEAHIYCAGLDLFHGVVGDANGSGIVNLYIVNLYGGRRLGVAKFFEGRTEGGGFFAVVEDGAHLSFSGA